jgi:hypothetical protein
MVLLTLRTDSRPNQERTLFRVNTRRPPGMMAADSVTRRAVDGSAIQFTAS